MLGEHEIQHVPAGDPHCLGVCVDLDGRGDRIGAGRLKSPLALNLDHTDAADTGDFQVGVITEGRDANPDSLGRLEYRAPERYLRLDPVYGDRDRGADGVGRPRLG